MDKTYFRYNRDILNIERGNAMMVSLLISFFIASSLHMPVLYSFLNRPVDTEENTYFKGQILKYKYLKVQKNN